jgi:ketosteroid isomerase-like protein
MDISQAVAELNDKFVDAVNSHDTPGWTALFAEDAVLIPAGQEAVTGRKGIEEWAEVATKIWNHLEVQQGTCTYDGNVAWQSGTWTGNINVPDGGTVDISGNFLGIAQKEGSTLRIKAHTWNVNPATPWPVASRGTRPLRMPPTPVHQWEQRYFWSLSENQQFTEGFQTNRLVGIFGRRSGRRRWQRKAAQLLEVPASIFISKPRANGFRAAISAID